MREHDDFMTKQTEDITVSKKTGAPQESPFIVGNLQEEKSVPQQYLKAEIQENISLFPADIRLLIERKMKGEYLDSVEYKTYDRAIAVWWYQKYGFPIYNKMARNELLMQNHGSLEELRKREELQSALFNAIEKNDEEKLRELKHAYFQIYPNQLEGVEVLFDLKNYLLHDKEREKKKKLSTREYVNPDTRKERARDFTQYHFLLTHFILLNGHDREFMKLFWHTAYGIAGRTDTIESLNKLIAGQISQVAVYRIIEAITGKEPKLSHPDEDAFKKIDLWANEDEAIQIKGWKEDFPAVLTSETVLFPAIQSDVSDTQSYLFNAAVFMIKTENNKFQWRVKQYGEIIGRNISGYMLVVPYKQLDPVNGTPSQELIDFFRKELAKHLSVEADREEGESGDDHARNPMRSLT